jgi:hyperosmotically inducible protein
MCPALCPAFRLEVKMKQQLLGLTCVLALTACNKDSAPYANKPAVEQTRTQGAESPKAVELPKGNDDSQNADNTREADNTGLNERDRAGTLTPFDQGNSEAETRITAAIRDGLMGDPAFSVTAKNVKVITVGQKVTLRGPALNDGEKAAIGALAQRTAGVNEVDNLLDVQK